MRLFRDASLDVSDPCLRRAFTLAERGRGTTSPNPMVGCVIVRGGEVIGEGWHAEAGRPHAEIVALRAAGEHARGADVYVTLEPCDHHGRTPPCTDALLEGAVLSVTAGMRDPNPTVPGGGAERMRASGVAVSFAEDATPFEEQNAAWIRHVTTGMPLVRVKTAVTLDGHPSLARGVRSRLTSAETSALTARLRAEADAVLVGASTCATDDPRLAVRDAEGGEIARQPLRVVLSRLTLPDPGARVFEGGGALVLASDAAPDDAVAQLHRAGIATERYPAAEGLRGAFAALGRRGVQSLLVEAGPGLLTALLEEDLADELVMYHAGGVAGEDAPALFLGAAASPGVDLVRRMRAVEAGVVGPDAVTVWRPERGTAAG